MIVALRLVAVLTVVTGLLYPLAMTGIAQLLFPRQAHGSLILRDGRVAGSELIGQHFEDPRYFWPRLSATSPAPYHPASSSGSNYGPLNADLKKAMDARRAALLTIDPGNTAPIPIDLLTASGSGLDPHIGPEAADYQAARVARARGIEPAKVAALIAKHTQQRQFGFLGQPVVNVLLLNRELDGL
ncbi:MAG: potassium-transporting ATPase subunit KdpC [Bryobacteraceae bacterium]|nr:potassium-transporting ATPase subunit KdpC [Bryobacteraceae bacterium]